MRYLYHLSDTLDFRLDPAPSSLQSEGFVHLSSVHQVLPTAERWFAHCDTLKLVVLREELLSDRLKWEDSYGRGEAFPHYYGALPLEAVETVTLLKRQNGAFSWPETIQGLLSPLIRCVPNRETALIEPSHRFAGAGIPEYCLLGCFPHLCDRVAAKRPHEVREGVGSAIGAQKIYLFEDLVLCFPGVGGPVAAAALEELIALGCRKFLLCGGAGSLAAHQPLGSLLLVNEAWRDEGLSHHYLPPSNTLKVSPEYLARLESGLQDLGVSVKTGTTWTTDALYRETPSRVHRRRLDGCLTVEMEVASLLAVAEFRSVEFGALLYCGDDLSGEQWDFRNWTDENSTQEKMLELGIELLKRLRASKP